MCVRERERERESVCERERERLLFYSTVDILYINNGHELLTEVLE